MSASALPPHPTSAIDAASTATGVTRLVKLLGDFWVRVFLNIGVYYSNGIVALSVGRPKSVCRYLLKTRTPGKTGGPDTHHSHLEEVVTTIVTYPGNYLRIPVNSL